MDLEAFFEKWDTRHEMYVHMHLQQQPRDIRVKYTIENLPRIDIARPLMAAHVDTIANAYQMKVFHSEDIGILKQYALPGVFLTYAPKPQRLLLNARVFTKQDFFLEKTHEFLQKLNIPLVN